MYNWDDPINDALSKPDIVPEQTVQTKPVTNSDKKLSSNVDYMPEPDASGVGSTGMEDIEHGAERIQVDDKAIINRLGFNNVGVEVAKDNIISKLDRFVPHKLGVNIGPNKDSINRIDDFINCYNSISKYADYVTFNLSSPNTPNLRDFESKEIDSLLSNIDSVRDSSKDIFINSITHFPRIIQAFRCHYHLFFLHFVFQ